ncbi:MAG: Non-specific serine/threonine protein kinase [Cyanobacteriota bacterium erpe_2018_sw_21hr_WHONDRS-SW48-000092_B_bin.40]|jgi:serine/threonine protein kinase|nr:Non-specific serine/threonine protein kinase [Cyanobacteriota bacterium erpe_2018_sw_21hr_WHONDRS-SW48-000092_B_bin.40]
MNSNSSPQDSRKPVGKNWCGRYELLGEIGRGGMGIVYRAIHPDTGHFVAIKQLVLENIAPEKRTEFKDRFKREAYTIARLKHPNIVDVIDICIEDDSFFYVMEFLDGDSLRKDLLRRGGKMSVEQLYPILSQVGEALSLAHSMSIVHRDVKPDNIFILKNGVVKLTDFGIARAAEFEESNLTKTGIMMGTLNYVSPEQLQDAKSVDHRADIFSLGIVCYEALSGCMPFTADGIAATIVKIISLEEKPLHILNPAISTEISASVGRAMRKKPRERYRSVTEFVKDFSATLSEQVKQSVATLADITGQSYENIPATNFRPVKTQFGITSIDGVITDPGQQTGIEQSFDSGLANRTAVEGLALSTATDMPQEQMLEAQQMLESNQMLETRHEFKAMPQVKATIEEPVKAQELVKAQEPLLAPAPRPEKSAIRHLLSMQHQGSGSTSKRFEEPAVLTCRAGRLAIADAVTRTINVFAYDGKNIEQTLRHLYEVAYKPAKGVNAESSRTRCGSITRPGGLAFDMKGRLFVCDASDQFIRVFDGLGAFLSEFRNIQAKDSGLAGITFDSSGLLYVSDSANACVQVFQPETGVWLRSLSGRTELEVKAKSIYAQDTDQQAQIRLPAGLATDRLNQLYLADYGSSKIFVFNKQGSVLRSFGNKGSELGELNIPRSVAVDRFDRSYVCDSFNNRLSIFDASGRVLYTFGEKGSGPSQLVNPSDIAIDNQYGIVFVCDRGNRRVQIYQLSGDFTGQEI